MPSESIDAFFADLAELASKHRMGDVRMGFKHDERGRLIIMLRTENAQFPWGIWYVPVGHPRRIMPKR